MQSEGRRPDRTSAFRQFLALAALLTILLLGLFFALTHESILVQTDRLGAWIESLGSWGMLAIVVLMVVHCFVPFPAEILALCAGAIFGTVVGTGLVWTGAMIGAALSFGLARLLGRAAVVRLLSRSQVASLDAWAADQGAVTLLISRFVPIIAFNLINYAAGLTQVSWLTFLWTTAVGILPLTTLMVYLGAAMVALQWEWIFGVSAFGIAVICGGHWFAKRRGWL